MNKKIGYLKIIVLLFFIIWTIGSIYSLIKPLPEGINIEGEIYNISENQIEFLYDLNYFDANQTRIHEQEIFNKIFEIINNSEKQILIDMFLFNSDYEDEEYRDITSQLKNELIRKKKENPNMSIVFITDEINNFYGSYESKEIKELKKEGINVVITDLTKLRDVNFVYAGFWRSYVQWFGTKGDGWIAHPLGNSDQKITLRSMLKLLNTKANHRKLIVADSGEEFVSIVTSANPHKASSLHSNVAFLVKGGIAEDILKSEESIAEFSGMEISLINTSQIASTENETTINSIQVQFLTEERIRDSLLDEIDNLSKNDSIKIGMFYLSDRKIVESILRADKRGVKIKLILDPNKDAFAREKNGIPNRQVAYELIKKSEGRIKIRWYNTKGEQYHSKIIILEKDGRIIVFLGSANLTKRNIGLYNLEADLKVSTENTTKLAKEIENYYEKIWNNIDGNYTLEFENYKDSSYWKYLLYRFQETSGFSSF